MTKLKVTQDGGLISFYDGDIFKFRVGIDFVYHLLELEINKSEKVFIDNSSHISKL